MGWICSLPSLTFTYWSDAFNTMIELATVAHQNQTVNKFPEMSYYFCGMRKLDKAYALNWKKEERQMLCAESPPILILQTFEDLWPILITFLWLKWQFHTLGIMELPYHEEKPRRDVYSWRIFTSPWKEILLSPRGNSNLHRSFL